MCACVCLCVVCVTRFAAAVFRIDCWDGMDLDGDHLVRARISGFVMGLSSVAVSVPLRLAVAGCWSGTPSADAGSVSVSPV